MQTSFLKREEIQGMQTKCGETYRVYGEPHFVPHNAVDCSFLKNVTL